MTIDIRSMKPAELTRLVNSTRFGAVLNDSKLRRHRSAGGYRVGTESTVDLLKYTAWLFQQTQLPAKAAQTWEETKRKAALRSAEIVRAAQDIGEIPEVANPERKSASLASFRIFCETYFAEIFYLPWSNDHLRVMEKIEKAVRTGGLFALAMPRGSGKTVLCQTAVLWASLSGASPFTYCRICLILIPRIGYT